MHCKSQVLKESLRLYPTAGIGFTKEAPQGCVLSGYHIPHGTTLWVSFKVLLQHN